MSRDDVWPKRWQQLAVMDDAGLSTEMALRTLAKNDQRQDQVLARVIGLVQRGVSLSNALLKSKAINTIDFTALSIAEKAGRLADGLTYISARRLTWNQRMATFNSTLLLPKALLLIGACAGVFVRVASAGQTLWSALVSVLLILIVAWVFIVLTIRLMKLDGLWWLSLGWRLPILRTRNEIFMLAFEQAFYRLFVWQIASGIRPDEAVSACSSLLSANSFKQSVIATANSMNRGVDIGQSLERYGLTLSTPLKRVMLTAQQAGVLENAVEHHLALQQQRLERKADDFFKWLPRLYYLIALLTISKFMFG